MMSDNQKRVVEIARKSEAIIADALAKADRLLSKTATLRHQVSRLKDDLAKEIAAKELEK